MKDGIYPNMTREQYDAQTGRENWSRLKNLGKSPAHYRHALLEPRKDSAALRNGRANHVAILEPEKFASEVAIWDGGRRASKAWDAFSEANAGKDILTQTEYEQLIGMQRAVRQHPIASRYLQRGRAEVSVLWTMTTGDEALGLPGSAMPCKSRLDYLAPEWIVDLKTCRDASPMVFGRAAFNLEYHAQAAYYVDAVAAVTGERLPYVIIAAELAAPCVVQVYRLPEHVLAAGRDHYRSLLFRLDECRREDRWDGYSDEEIDLELPRWSGIEAPEAEGESLEDLGLAINS
jgi:hypothetical protein